ncbi:TonB-dependent receptor [Muricauda sp. SCSIO 64092]|uniref:SusC/RagA family TonB-linked outer membrane protein n=1 Tax=Allomuricauda sp. SCSIO 64092 TaxID=2908842 RepID=UPI001FF6D873|nr:TonB-dependent receptor [Muricauda sp. SCSIO 64092]UOY05100.1 TonB-dependent receptor [Muricauda sp. SCSIO 64092]
MKSMLTWMLTPFLVLTMSFSLAQEKTISGNVTDQDGLPLPGVSIVVVGTTSGTQTDFDGNYSITASQGQVLRFTYIGQATVNRTVGSGNTINVQMEEDAQALEEVVVVAYGEKSRQKVITSISEVDSEAIEDLVVDSPQNILQGQAAGVQVVSSSGTIGAAPEVRIRGTNSIGGNSRPLFVVDGVVLGDTFNTLAQGTGQGINPLATINPNDIESISVLKSAAAAALYGSRGGNGVVLITTKRGRTDGRVTVDINTNVSFSTLTDSPDLMNAQEFIDFTTSIRSVTGQTLLTDSGDDVDMIDLVTRTAVSTSSNISVRGGNENVNYFIGATRENLEVPLIGGALDRTSFRANVEAKATDWLTAGMNLNVSQNNFDLTPAENSFGAPYTVAILQRPDRGPFDEDGNFRTSGNVGGGNVIAQEVLEQNDQNTTRIIGNAYLNFDLSSFIPGLSFKQELGVDRNFDEAIRRDVELLTPGGFALNRISQQNRTIVNSLLSYNKTFGDHTLNILAGYSFEENAFRVLRADGTGFLSDDQRNIESAATFPTTFSSGDETTLVSYLSRISYDYANGRYLLEGSLRRDGSSVFGANNRFGTFWSLAAGWNISEEPFMQNVNWIQGLKLNGSYGSTGNDRIFTAANFFPALGTFGTNNYNGESGLTPLVLANPDLKWESTTTWDIGLSASFFNRGLSFTLEYYNRTTDDLILNVPVDPTFNNGLNSVLQNVGEMENRGFELSLDAVIFDNPDGFSWNSNFNIAYNVNEVTSLPETSSVDEQGRRFVEQIGGSLANSPQRAVEGESANSWYLIPYIGVNSQTGDTEWLDADGNPTTSPTAADRRIVGQGNPDFIGGFSNVFTFKNWSLSTLFNYSFGNDMLLTSREFTENPVSGFNKTTRLLNVWEQPGDQAFVPSPSSPTIFTFAQTSTAQLADASFVRLKNVTLSYTLPRSLIDRTFLNNIRFFVTGTNLLTIKSDDLEGYDPEGSNRADGAGTLGQDFFTVPQASTFTLGMNVSF